MSLDTEQVGGFKEVLRAHLLTVLGPRSAPTFIPPGDWRDAGELVATWIPQVVEGASGALNDWLQMNDLREFQQRLERAFPHSKSKCKTAEEVWGVDPWLCWGLHLSRRGFEGYSLARERSLEEDVGKKGVSLQLLTLVWDKVEFSLGHFIGDRSEPVRTLYNEHVRKSEYREMMRELEENGGLLGFSRTLGGGGCLSSFHLCVVLGEVAWPMVYCPPSQCRGAPASISFCPTTPSTLWMVCLMSACGAVRL